MANIMTAEKIFTERAHLMCPRMYFGIAMQVDRACDESRIKRSFEILAGNHPFLRAVLGYDGRDNSYFYDITESSKVELIFCEGALTGADDSKLLKEYERLTGYDWDIREEGMLKAVVWSLKDRTVFLLVFHHLLADGRGAMNLAQELADLYVKDKRKEPVTEKLISSADDFPRESRMPFISRKLVDKANRDWAKEMQQPLTYRMYHEYADKFIQTDKVSVSLKKTSAEETARMAAACRKHSVTVNDFLMARMYREDKTDKIIIAKDLRDRLPFYNEGALGNYSTAFSIVIRKLDKDMWTLAREVHKMVQKTIANPADLYLVLQCYACLSPEVLDAAFMAAKGAFKSKSAGFIGRMFFGFEVPRGYSITNLGKIESSSIINAYFIPPASPAIRKTVGVLTVNGEMVECVRERAIQ